MGLLDFKKRPQIIQGMDLPMLLKVLARHDFQVDRECYGRLAYLLALGVFNSIYGACETFFNSEDIEGAQVIENPIFIVGHWRSGTTHLHNLMSLNEDYACPTAYQALFPNHFIFSQVGGLLFNLIAPTTRPMDNVTFSANVPHEDEFALAAHCGVSPYMRTWFPVTGGGAYSEVDPNKLPPEALESWRKSFLLFLKKMALSEGKPLILKSPPHLGRVALLREMLPQSKFIHIIRNPYVIYASTHRLWDKSLGAAHLQIPSSELVDQIILSWFKEMFDLYERDKSLLPEGSLVEVKFEDLEKNPLVTLERIFDALGLKGFDKFSVRVISYLNSIKDYKKNEHILTESDKAKVRAYWAPIFERYGYSMD